MRIIKVNGNHWFEKFSSVGFFLIRSHCTCGWKSKLFFWSARKATDGFYNHLAETSVEE